VSFEGVIVAGSLVTPESVVERGWVEVRGGVVVGVGQGAPPAGRPVVDVGERLCAPGFVDLHVHGGDGSQVNADSAVEGERAVRRLARFHARHGTTALVPTTVSDSPERTRESVRGVAAACGEVDGGGRVLGVHLEGPWLSPARKGAQDPAWLRGFDEAELEALLDAAAGTLRMVTLAPEVAGADAAIAALWARGIVVSLGHTDAEYDTATRAIAAGARHVAHLFNAMSPMAHGAPGMVGAALASREVSLELIADGHHVHPAVLAVAFRAARRPVLVTDATAAAGLQDGPFPLGDVDVVLRNGRVTLAGDDRVLAGSALTMDAALRVMVRDAGVPLHSAVTAASATPAAVAGRPDLGRLAAGAPADLVILDDDLRAVATMVAGRTVHDPSGLLA
jgi:N-acetylglucosamine-6-phosphate deacetylase